MKGHARSLLGVSVTALALGVSANAEAGGVCALSDRAVRDDIAALEATVGNRSGRSGRCGFRFIRR